MKKVVVMALGLFIAFSAQAKDEKVTVTGVLQYGTLDSSITDESGNDITFISNDPKSKKIFDKCHGGDVCKATAMVEKNEYGGTLKKLISVELVKKSE